MMMTTAMNYHSDNDETIELNKKQQQLQQQSQQRSHRRPPRQAPIRAPRLGFAAYLWWTMMSFVASGLIGAGYWIPHWIRGTLHHASSIDASFGAFRRCNYPILDPDTRRIQIVLECGRYATFDHIPSLAWKVSAILIGVGAASSLLVAFILFFALCMPHSMRCANARVLLVLQLFTLLFVLSGCAFYPLGWSNREVRDVCGPQAMPYEIGSCQLSYSAYMMGGGMLSLSLCLLLGLASISNIRRQNSKSYDNLMILD